MKLMFKSRLPLTTARLTGHSKAQTEASRQVSVHCSGLQVYFPTSLRQVLLNMLEAAIFAHTELCTHTKN